MRREVNALEGVARDLRPDRNVQAEMSGQDELQPVIY